MTTRDSLLILGRQPALGLAELESLHGAEQLQLVGREAARLKLKPDAVHFARLGGSIKLCKVLSVFEATRWPDIQRSLEQTVVEQLASLPEGKIRLGLSAYGLNVKPTQLVAAGLTLKKKLKSAGRSVRLVPNQEPTLNSAQVLHNHLTGPTGCELVLVRDGSKTICVQTVVEQDIESYTLRDRGRPKRDARVGMLPPKLAQIIINLATGTELPSVKKVGLDPFCGTGVILQETLLMGFSAYGTDLDQRMVDYSIANVHDWFYMMNHPELKGKLTIATGDATTKTWEDDAWSEKKEDFNWAPASIDFVASETYLGQPFSSFPSAEKLEQVRATCNLVIEKFLANIGKQIKSGTRLCLAVPAWQQRPGQFIHLPVLDHLEELGYNRVKFEHVQTQELIYSREGQIVGRELLVITRK